MNYRRSANQGVKIVNLNRAEPFYLDRLPGKEGSGERLQQVLGHYGLNADDYFNLSSTQQSSFKRQAGLASTDPVYPFNPTGFVPESFTTRPSIADPIEIGSPAFKTEYSNQGLPIVLNRSRDAVNMPGEYAIQDIENRSLQRSDLQNTRQVLGAYNANETTQKDMSDVLMRGGFPVSTSAQMALERPTIQGGRWVDAPMTEYDNLQGGSMVLTNTGDAITNLRPRTASQGDQMKYSDFLEGRGGESNIAKAAELLDSQPISFKGVPNAQYLSSAPSRIVPFEQKQWEMVNADGSITPIYKTVKGSDVIANRLMDRGLARPVATKDVTEDLFFRDQAVPPAFQPPETTPAKGGYDLTTMSTARDYPAETWENTNLEVMLPSTVLADKGLSPYKLTQNSQIPVKELGRQRYSDDPYYDRMEDERMIDVNAYDDYVSEKGGQFYEPMQDAQSVVDRLGAAQRRANTGYQNKVQRVQVQSPNTMIAPRLQAQAIMRENNLTDDQREAMSRAMGGMSIGRQPTDTQLSELTQSLAPVREYSKRVDMANKAVADAYQKLGNLPDVEDVRVTELIKSGNGYDTIVETLPMSVKQRLNESRDLQDRGYGQAAISLPTQTTVGPESLNSLLVWNHTKKLPGNRVERNGSQYEVFPLDDRQKAQFEAEIASGQRKVMPVGTTQPSISKSNEFIEEGIPTGVAQSLPINRGNFSANEDEAAGYLDRPIVADRGVISNAERNATAGMRLRGEPTGTTQGTLVEAEIMKRRDAMLQRKFGDNWQQYVVG